MTESIKLHPSDDVSASSTLLFFSSRFTDLATFAPRGSLQPATQSNYNDIRTTHLHLDWTVDFSQSFIRGSVVHSLVARKDRIDHVVFDSSFISIKKITTVEEGGEKELKWDLPKRHKTMGSGLRVELGKSLNKGEKIDVKIQYSTTDDCTALGWLTPEQVSR